MAHSINPRATAKQCQHEQGRANSCEFITSYMLRSTNGTLWDSLIKMAPYTGGLDTIKVNAVGWVGGGCQKLKDIFVDSTSLTDDLNFQIQNNKDIPLPIKHAIDRSYRVSPNSGQRPNTDQCHSCRSGHCSP